MNDAGDFATHHRDGNQVLKRLDTGHPATARFVEALAAAGRNGTEEYLVTLRDAGVQLPPGLQVVREKPLVVRHDWVDGPDLLSAARAAPEQFIEAVMQIGQWARDLDPTDARIDTNLANFCLVDGHPVLVDVLPPLIVSRRPQPANLFEALFSGLCFDTEVILAALVGYAARALLRGAAGPPQAARFVPVARELCSPRGMAVAGPLAEMWFRSRVALALRALSGELPADVVHGFFALTSVRVFRDLDEPQRARRVEHVRETLRGLRDEC